MKRKVIVTLTGTQGTDRTVTGGTGGWKNKGKEHRISFAEGESGVFCDAYLAEGELRFVRKGEVSSEMVFRPGERTSCLYATGEGTFALEIETIKIGLHASAQGASAFARYRIMFEGGEFQENTIMLRAKVCS